MLQIKTRCRSNSPLSIGGAPGGRRHADPVPKLWSFLFQRSGSFSWRKVIEGINSAPETFYKPPGI